ncbi:MAG: hypothetical protein JWM85_2059 [Acidimicrobiaceae bacterium]|nr:hypothetical protein [Acidimicrobiaceae bacterium]
MTARERDLTDENEALREEIGVLRRELDGARLENEMLSGRIAELEARLGQSSRSSSLPPSSDSPKSRAERRAAAREQQKGRAKEEKRSRGKQPGAPGANL